MFGYVYFQGFIPAPQGRNYIGIVEVCFNIAFGFISFAVSSEAVTVLDFVCIGCFPLLSHLNYALASGLSGHVINFHIENRWKGQCGWG